MIFSKQRFQHSIQLFPQVAKETAPLLLPLNVIMWWSNFYIENLMKAHFENPYSVSMILIYTLVIIGILYQGLFSVIWTLYVARSSQRQAKNGHGPHPLSFLKTHFYQAFIEYIRAAVSISIYCLFFIIPGFYRWIQLTFVCFVASFDKDYLEGKKDALKESARLVRGYLFSLLLLISLYSLMPLIVTLFPNISSNQIISLGWSCFISWILSTYLSIYISLTFFALSSVKTEKPS